MVEVDQGRAIEGPISWPEADASEPQAESKPGIAQLGERMRRAVRQERPDAVHLRRPALEPEDRRERQRPGRAARIAMLFRAAGERDRPIGPRLGYGMKGHHDEKREDE